MPLIPVYIYEKDDALPDEGTYYVLGSNGTFLHKDTGIVKGLVRVDKIPGLGVLEAQIRMNLPKLPVSVVYRCLVFFRRVWYQYKSESALVLWYNQTTSDYYLHCPTQQVSHGGVRYDPGRETSPENVAFVTRMRQEGYKKVGTVHSHCDFGAYHSGVDTADEAKFDGVHITIGNVDKETFSLASSLVVNDNRFPVDPQSVMLGIETASQTTAKAKWMTYQSPDKWYNMSIGDEEREQIINVSVDEIERDWMPKVSPQVYRNSGSGRKGWYSQVFEDKHFGMEDSSDNWRSHVGAVTGGPLPIQPAALESAAPAFTVDVIPDEVPVVTAVEVTPVHDEAYLRQVRSAAYALHQHADRIPQDRVQALRSLLQKFFQKPDITDEDIQKAMEVNPKKEVKA